MFLQLTRNQFMDGTVKMPNGSTVTKKDFVQLQRKCMDGEISKGFYLKDILLNCQGSDRQIVKWAAKLLSHLTAQLFRDHFSDPASPNHKGKMALADFIDAIAEAFLILTSTQVNHPVRAKCALGKCLKIIQNVSFPFLQKILQ